MQVPRALDNVLFRAIVLIIVISLSSCKEPSTPEPTKVIDDILWVDCLWVRTAQAWLDLDEDGQWDGDEAPLPGVLFFVDNTRTSHAEIGDYAVTNMQGEAYLSVGPTGCLEVEFEVYPEVPTGFRLTTQERVPAHSELDDEQFRFGFSYLHGVPTVTPRPSEAISCTSYRLPGELEYANVGQLVASPDGTMWGETIYSIFRFDWGNNHWETYDEQTGLPSTFVNTMFVTEDGVLWVATSGVSFFDGSSWTTYSTEDGLLANDINSIAHAPDETVWLVSYNGVSHLTPSTGRITTYPLDASPGTEHLDSGVVTPDGSLWVASPWVLSQLPPREQPVAGGTWISHYYPPYWDFSANSSFGIRSSPDGTLWFLGRTYRTSNNSSTVSDRGYALANFSPSSEQWTVYSHQTTNGAVLGEFISDFAIAPDGSVWASTTRNGAFHLFPSPGDDLSKIRVIYYTEPVLRENRLQCIALARDGAIWFGAPGNLIRCAPATALEEHN